MSILDDLIMKVEDPVLRDRLKKEVHKATKHKQFGLVFEEHLPECTPLCDVPIKKGSRVAPRDTEIKTTYIVRSINGNDATCVSNDDKSEHVFKLSDIVVVAEFGEPIYPYLQTIDTVCNAPDSDLWHTLIEADNYHALQLLEYMYAGKVDCIYIDPPYNKEDSKDWKYNCNYVDGNDMYRHSKWLSMMERRLKLAKKLLNPNDSVLIVTIDELEYLHLGMLLEQMFPEARIQMISMVINPHGANRKDMFARVEEYIYVVMFGSARITPQKENAENTEIRWMYLRRPDLDSRRGTIKGGTAQFYPIYVDDKSMKIVKIGDALPVEVSRFDAPSVPGTTAVFPVREDGTELNWGVTGKSLKRMIDDGLVRISKSNNPLQPYVIKYTSENYKEKVLSGELEVKGTRPDGSKIIVQTGGKNKPARTILSEKKYEAGAYGSVLLKNILGEKRFQYPKSVYAVKDTIGFFVANKPNALIVDFFAGSGTTLHAVNLINADDKGHRRCIMITNNEIGFKTEKEMKAAGYKPGDVEWEIIGIAKYVTWPRTVCSIKGLDINNNPLKGNYLDNDRPIAYGFEANAIYFKLDFLDKNAVALGRQFKELLGVLWMKAGAIGPCPSLAKNATIPDMMILPENKMAILINDVEYATFKQEIQEHPEIETVYIITDSDRGYREMITGLDVDHTYQLYRDYLDNFRINHRR